VSMHEREAFIESPLFLPLEEKGGFSRVRKKMRSRFEGGRGGDRKFRIGGRDLNFPEGGGRMHYIGIAERGWGYIPGKKKGTKVRQFAGEECLLLFCCGGKKEGRRCTKRGSSWERRKKRGNGVLRHRQANYKKGHVNLPRGNIIPCRHERGGE